MIGHILWFVLGCFLLVKAAGFAVRALSNVGRVMRIPEFLISFLVVGVISTFPEFFVSVIAAVQGFPTLGFGTLIGSNVADLTLVIALMVLLGGTIHVGTKSLRYDFFYLVLAAVPIILALDGLLSRLDGAVLVLLCVIFFYHIIRESYHFRKVKSGQRKRLLWDVILFMLSIGVLLWSADIIVKYAGLLAVDFGVRKVFIGLVLIALGTTLPELTFGIKALKKGLSDMALGDILGNVIIDATFVLGIVAFIAPITLNLIVVASAGLFMVLGMFLLTSIIERGHHTVTRMHAWWLLAIYVVYVIFNWIISHFI